MSDGLSEGPYPPIDGSDAITVYTPVGTLPSLGLGGRVADPKMRQIAPWGPAARRTVGPAAPRPPFSESGSSPVDAPVKRAPAVGSAGRRRGPPPDGPAVPARDLPGGSSVGDHVCTQAMGILCFSLSGRPLRGTLPPYIWFRSDHRLYASRHPALSRTRRPSRRSKNAPDGPVGPGGAPDGRSGCSETPVLGVRNTPRSSGRRPSGGPSLPAAAARRPSRSAPARSAGPRGAPDGRPGACENPFSARGRVDRSRPPGSGDPTPLYMVQIRSPSIRQSAPCPISESEAESPIQKCARSARGALRSAGR